MKNREISRLLREIADFLEIRETEYKPRAYREAARSVESLSEPIEAVHERGELEEVEGVGESIAATIAEYLDTGELAYYDELRRELPVDIEAITSVEGVGPKTAKTLYLELGVATLEDLERAAREGEIATLEGFGERSQRNILERLPLAREGQERMLLGRAFPVARELEERLRASPAFDRVDVVGSFRRRRPTVGDIDVLATAEEPAEATALFCGHDDVTEVLARGETKSSVLVSGELRIDLRLVEHREYGSALVYFTGSKRHNIRLRNRAIDRGETLNEYGLFEAGEDGRAGDRLAGETEADVYEALALAWIPPELREDTGEVAAAAAGELPDLLEPGDLRGDLQLHTAYSDGSASVREMAAAADERGLEYVLVTDHGPGAGVPSRLDEAAFDRQCEEVAALNADGDLGVTVLQGVEAEITADGLGVPDSWCERCDLVVGAMHSRPENPTERLVAAVESSPVDVLAHPTGRLLGEREPLELDLDRLMDAAAAAGVAIEINAQPARLDLDWASVKAYRDTVSYVVSTDAHTTGELEQMHLGVAQARRGWCEAADVLNTLPRDELLARLSG